MLPGGGTRKHVSHGHGAQSAGYLARPRLGTVRGVYSARPLSTRPPSYLLGSTAAAGRKMKYRKTGTGSSKMDSYKKRPDPVDTAYREAVGRLKVLLAESYTVPIVGKRTLRDDSGDDTDNQSLLSSRSRHSHHHYHRTSPFISRRYPYYPTSHTVPSKYEKSNTHTDYKSAPETERKEVSPEKWEEKQPAPEMMSFIHRQEDYIEQLEREAQFCRDELSGLLGKVKEVISENENLHERQKSNLIKSVFDHLETETETEVELELKSPRKSPKKSRRLEGPSIVFESRISELEAQLTQTKIELRKLQEENDNYKRKIADGTIGDLSNFDSFKMQIENLQREKGTLQEQITKLQYELVQLKERNNDTSHKIKRSLDVVEQAQFEKTQLESEIRRLKDELDRQHDKLRESIHEQGRRIADERSAVERRYTQQIEQLTAELGIQWETTSKLQLELDKQRREDSDVRREVAQKQAHIDELRKEMQNKTATLQSDLAASGAERGALEQQVAALNLAVERAERQGKAEAARLQAEVQSLRQRLDRADADLLHSRRENLRLSEQVASLEKELNMSALLAEDKKQRPLTSGGGSTEPVSMTPLPLPAPKDREKELSSMIKDMEAKHVSTVAELEGMIQSQNQLMEKLTSECHLLTQKLEDASTRHKEEIRELQTNLDYLSNKFNKQANVVQSSPKDDQHLMDNNERSAPMQQHPGTLSGPRDVTEVTHTPASPVNAIKHPVPSSPNTESRKPSVTLPQQHEQQEQQQHSSPPQREPSPPQQESPPPRVTTPNRTTSEEPSVATTQQEIDQQQEYYPSEQQEYTEQQNYPPDQTYDEQQYPQQEYDQQKTDDYPMDQQYTDDQYQNQYSADPNYPVDQQYLPEQQYDEQQYLEGQQYDENQQYVMDQQQYQQDYPMEQDYPTDQQYSTEQTYDSNQGDQLTEENQQTGDNQQTVDNQQAGQQPVAKQQPPVKQPETK